jgi:hypothetical protein
VPLSVSTAARSPPALSLARKAKIGGEPWSAKQETAEVVADGGDRVGSVAVGAFDELRPRCPVLAWPMTGSNPGQGPLAWKNFGRWERSSLFSKDFLNDLLRTYVACGTSKSMVLRGELKRSLCKYFRHRRRAAHDVLDRLRLDGFLFGHPGRFRRGVVRGRVIGS